MMSSSLETIRVEAEAGVMRVTLARPDVRNAFNRTLVHELTQTFSTVPEDVIAVILQGDGKVFCAGADLAMMKESIGFSREQNVLEARTMAKVFEVVDRCPVPVIGRVHGAAVGGGAGLVACCDMVVAADDAKFAFSEVRLGIAPAVISPFVIAKIGVTQARRYFLTGDMFDAATALRIGLVHDVVPAASLDNLVQVFVDSLRASGPQAVRATKHLIRQVAPVVDHTGVTSQLIADLRASDEGQAMIGRFLAGANKPAKPSRA